MISCSSGVVALFVCSERETIKALQAPKVADKLSGLGVDPMVVPPAEFGKR
jgi:hypothetical protein